jgi:tetratricopeptide (TPR) repeat protein
VRVAVVASALAAALAGAGCTPQTALLAAAVPPGTASVLLSQTQRVADDNRRRIAALDAARDWPELARFAEAQIKRDPHTPDWWFVAGYAEAQQGAAARAAERYAEAVRLEPDVTLYWSLLAQAWRAAGQPNRALAVLDNALLARRDDAPLHVLQGDIRLEQGRTAAALNAYRAALAVDERHVPAWQGIERAYRADGRTGEADAASREWRRLSKAAGARAVPPR